jgi:hypothetical protein
MKKEENASILPQAFWEAEKRKAFNLSFLLASAFCVLPAKKPLPRGRGRLRSGKLNFYPLRDVFAGRFFVQ